MKLKQAKRCKNCNRTIRYYNKSGYCAACYREIVVKGKNLKEKLDEYQIREIKE